MSTAVLKKTPEIVMKDGRPAAVILDIADYREMLERRDDAEDLKMLRKMRRKGLKFRSLDDFLAEHRPRASSLP